MCWGFNGYGQLGIANASEMTLLPAAVNLGTGICKLTCKKHAYFNDSVMSWRYIAHFCKS